MWNKDVPIIFIFFKRLETTKQVFETIKRHQPSKLLLVADGARNDDEQKQVDRVREYVESNIDWDCEVYKNYAPRNMGCKNRIISGLTWAFTEVESAIILEDDVVPNDSFFDFTAELLDYYRDDERVMMIGGYNFYGDIPISESYTFFNRTSIWGWATWKRAWDKMDAEMNGWKKLKSSGYIQKNFARNVATMLIRDFDRAYYKEVDTWDYTWEYSVVLNKGLCILPRVNLITNVGGNDADATHTFGDVKNYDISDITFPLVHPKTVDLNKAFIDELEAGEGQVSYFKEYIKAHLPRTIVRKLQAK